MSLKSKFKKLGKFVDKNKKQIGGGLIAATGAVLTATGVAAPLGAPLMATGAGMALQKKKLGAALVDGATTYAGSNPKLGLGTTLSKIPMPKLVTALKDSGTVAKIVNAGKTVKQQTPVSQIKTVINNALTGKKTPQIVGQGTVLKFSDKSVSGNSQSVVSSVRQAAKGKSSVLDKIGDIIQQGSNVVDVLKKDPNQVKDEQQQAVSNKKSLIGLVVGLCVLALVYFGLIKK